MFGKGEQKEIQITGIANKVVNGNDSSTNNFFNSQSSKLSALFIRLKNVFDDTENPEELINISENLKKYTDLRDTLGLEKKLELANKEHLYDDFVWCKQEFNKKLIYYQNYEPAQEIFRHVSGNESSDI